MIPSGRMKAEVIREISILRKNEFYKTLAMLRTQINISIMEAAGHGRKYVTVDVPRSYVGRDSYNAVEMGKALVQQLQEDGFTVTGTYLRFFIAWEKPETRKTTRRSPSPLIKVPKPNR